MGSSSCEQSCLDIWWFGWSGGWNLQTFGGILIWADKESIKGEAGKVAVGEGTYSTWSLSIANNNSADRAVPNAFSCGYLIQGSPFTDQDTLKGIISNKINPVDIFFCLLAVLETSSISLKQPLGFVPSSHDLSVEELGETALI